MRTLTTIHIKLNQETGKGIPTPQDSFIAFIQILQDAHGCIQMGS